MSDSLPTTIQITPGRIPKNSDEAKVFYNTLTQQLATLRGKNVLRSFYWTQPVDEYEDTEEFQSKSVPPKELWDALSKVDSLEELYLSFTEEEHETWYSLETARMPKLARLKIDMYGAHGWSIGPLKAFVSNHAPSLAHLAILFPSCCGPFEFDLTTTKFPLLQSFEMTCSSISPGERRPQYLPEDFLHEHPRLEQLYLDIDDCPMEVLDEKHLPLLSRLCVNTSCSWSLDQDVFGSLFAANDTGKRRKISHFKLGGCSSSEQVMEILRLMDGQALRCLQLACYGENFVRSITPHVKEILELFPYLRELGFLKEGSSSPAPPQLCEEDLRQFLDQAQAKTAKLEALEFHFPADEPLPPSSDFQIDLANYHLRCLKWDVNSKPIMHEADEHGQTLSRMVARRQSTKQDWASGTILDHRA
ncbi:hypothetical protein V5O48_002950 [Marasmius crinis-equi]|uniref:Uncharacterized protein n=1 Tax=Marasmius crinis-equi TaxID=585013 RepID=A0ABR3FU76_9AGAR